MELSLRDLPELKVVSCVLLGASQQFLSRPLFVAEGLFPGLPYPCLQLLSRSLNRGPGLLHPIKQQAVLLVSRRKLAARVCCWSKERPLPDLQDQYEPSE